MQQYILTYEIDIDADSVEQAAKLATEFMKTDHIATWEAFDENGEYAGRVDVHQDGSTERTDDCID